MLNYTEICANILNHDNGQSHKAISLMGDIRVEANCTRVYDAPSYADDRQGTRFAYIETAYTYRSEEWSVSAYAVIEVPKWFEKTDKQPRLNFDIETATNIDRRATYSRFDQNNNLSDPKVLAAKTALAKVAGAKPFTDVYKGVPMSINKRDVLGMIESAAKDKLKDDENVRKLSYYSGEGYAARYRLAATQATHHDIWERGYEHDTTVYGKTITDADLKAIANRLIKAHKQELNARAKAL